MTTSMLDLIGQADGEVCHCPANVYRIAKDPLYGPLHSGTPQKIRKGLPAGELGKPLPRNGDFL
jgi:hypothetical protein